LQAFFEILNVWVRFVCKTKRFTQTHEWWLLQSLAFALEKQLDSLVGEFIAGSAACPSHKQAENSFAVQKLKGF